MPAPNIVNIDVTPSNDANMDSADSAVETVCGEEEVSDDDNTLLPSGGCYGTVVSSHTA